MKVIINQPRSSYFVGGAEMISFDHARYFLELGNDVSFFTISPQSIGQNVSTQYKEFCEKYRQKINIVEIEQDQKIIDIYKIQPGEDRCRWNIESIFYNQKLYDYLSSNNSKFDAIISYYNLDAVFLPKNLVTNNVLYLCGTPKQQDDYQGSFLSVYDRVFAISEKVESYWKRYYKDKIDVVSTGVDNNRFSLKTFSKTDTKTTNILYVGRLIARKNVDKIIFAVENLRKKYLINLTIVGDGPERTRLEKISKNTVFTGVVSNTEQYYKNADIFVSPSEYGEGLQGCILEAMSCGLTVVATNSEINKIFLKEGRGFIVEPTIDKITEGIEKAIKINFEQVAKKVRKYIIDNYNWIDKVYTIQERLK